MTKGGKETSLRVWAVQRQDDGVGPVVGEVEVDQLS